MGADRSFIYLPASLYIYIYICSFEWCLYRDRTLTRAILVHLIPDCWEETIDRYLAGFFLYIQLKKTDWQKTGDLVRRRSTAVLFNIWKIVWSKWHLWTCGNLVGEFKKATFQINFFLNFAPTDSSSLPQATNSRSRWGAKLKKIRLKRGLFELANQISTSSQMSPFGMV